MVGASMPPRGRDEGEEKQIQQVETTAADETGREWPDFYLLISRVRELLSLCRCWYRPLQNTSLVARCIAALSILHRDIARSSSTICQLLSRLLRVLSQNCSA